MPEITEQMDDDALRAAVEAVEENNRQWNAPWADWDDPADIEEAFGVHLCEAGRAVIERAIGSDGESLGTDLPAVERAVRGHTSSDPFWAREPTARRRARADKEDLRARLAGAHSPPAAVDDPQEDPSL